MISEHTEQRLREAVGAWSAKAEKHRGLTMVEPDESLRLESCLMARFCESLGFREVVEILNAAY